MTQIVVAALYQFKPLTDLPALQASLYTLCQIQKIKGTLLLAEEGINGTVAGSREAITALKAHLDRVFDDLEYKESWAEKMPFHRLKIKIKKEIVTLGVSVDPRHLKGTYVTPEDWNHLIQDPEILLIDTRNDYEVQIGTFQGAINPQTHSFTEFPEFVKTLKKDQKIAMCCTGGIRCEKASSYMLSQGFSEVYHLKGGILKYIETIPPEQSLWKGDCFVFDGRVALSSGLALSNYEMCYGCRTPLSQEDRESVLYERGVACPHCYDTTPELKKQRARERHHQEILAKRRGRAHIGAVRENRKVV